MHYRRVCRYYKGARCFESGVIECWGKITGSACYNEVMRNGLIPYVYTKISARARFPLAWIRMLPSRTPLTGSVGARPLDRKSECRETVRWQSIVAMVSKLVTLG